VTDVLIAEGGLVGSAVAIQLGRIEQAARRVLDFFTIRNRILDEFGSNYYSFAPLLGGRSWWLQAEFIKTGG
jgi:hypothetical protein